MAGVVGGGLAVAKQEALKVAHGDGEVVGDPDLGWQADQAAVRLGDLWVLDDEECDGVVEEIAEG